MPTIVGFQHLRAEKNSIQDLYGPEKCLISWYFHTYEHLKFHDQLSWEWKKFYNLKASLHCRKLTVRPQQWCYRCRSFLIVTPRYLALSTASNYMGFRDVWKCWWRDGWWKDNEPAHPISSPGSFGWGEMKEKKKKKNMSVAIANKLLEQLSRKTVFLCPCLFEE